MRHFWLIFAQTVTICLGLVMVLQQFYPSLLPQRQQFVEVQQSPPQATPQPATNSYRRAAGLAMPTVVNIFTRKQVSAPSELNPLLRRFFGDQFGPQQRSENSLGSGVIVSAQGLILTNHHVVEAAEEIDIALADGRRLPATMVGTDPETDLAVLKVEAKNLPAITFGRSDNISVGDVVLAIGNPFGVGQTVTQGIISALGRNHLGINTFENFIQTDASINPGNSGGALIDTEGRLIGINSAIYSKNGGSMGIGFAIPVNLAKQVMEQIVRQGSVTRGWLGVEAQDLSPELAESFAYNNLNGALITGILRNGPADQAGVLPGDILLEINGRTVINGSAMLNLIASLKPGSPATLKVFRKKGVITLQGKVGRRPTPHDS